MTIKRNALVEYFLFITVDAPITMGENRDKRYECGMDFGLKTFLGELAGFLGNSITE